MESPTKVRTIKKYLGDDFRVAATVGHIKDLPEKEIGIDINKDFKPKYVIIPGKNKVIRSLRQAAEGVEDIYLAPDPDREGEAIAWHTAEVLKKPGRRFHRVLFHELTKNGITSAISHPEQLNESKYKAQQARRILDRLVGYQISPLLWKKVKYGLSAGRVQSVAVRMICDREREIFAFEPEEFWSITAELEGKAPPRFLAKLVKKKNRTIKIKDSESASRIVSELKAADFVVSKVDSKTVRRRPQPPFTTSKLQQDAIRKLRFTAKKTMTVAQQLYEGVDVAGETLGLITYMRTDSTRIAKEAAQAARDFIINKFGPDYTPPKPRSYPNKNRAQDAHEAIRPTDVRNTPEKVAPYLTKDQAALYGLIWRRFVASQMADALIDQKTIHVTAGDYLLTATGSTIRFDGFLSVYKPAENGNNAKDKEKVILPEVTPGEVLRLVTLTPKQHFTAPPPRYTEASLVKALEENGIGRPSTYASILSTIREKGYVLMEKGRFYPTELGFIVTDLLVANFPEILDIDFTAKMEQDLDKVEASQQNPVDLLRTFYGSLEKRISQAVEHMLSIKGVGLATGIKCPECQKELRIKVGKNGPFLACSGYPECKFSSDYTRDDKGNIVPLVPEPEAATGETCEKCGRPMVMRRGRYGDFLACSGYPECKTTRSVNGGGQGGKTGMKCPEEGCDGEIIERRSKRGKLFYGCSRYPDCSFASWSRPVSEECPDCGSPYLVEKETKRYGKILACPQKGCRYKSPIEKPGDDTNANGPDRKEP